MEDENREKMYARRRHGKLYCTSLYCFCLHCLPLLNVTELPFYLHFFGHKSDRVQHSGAGLANYAETQVYGKTWKNCP